MTVYEQATATTQVPYMHLGYLASTASRLRDGGTTFVGLGVLLVVLVAFSKVLPAWLRVPRKQYVNFTALGIALVGLGIVMWCRVGPAEMSLKKRVTRARALSLLATADEQKESELPKDGWGKAFRVVCDENDNVTKVISSGPDGIFETDDDLDYHR